MFSGIVEELGVVQEVAVSGDSAKISVGGELLKGLPRKEGDSIAVSGVCLTIVDLDVVNGIATFDLASETRRCTTLGLLSAGSRVNLERPMMIGERIHGHFVQGHVDAMTALRKRTVEENTIRLVFTIPDCVADLVSPKGSVTLDGVSLTVGEVTDVEFSVYIIPHTASITTLGYIAVGSQVNLEADCLARYVKTIMEHRCNR
jgi:riboflavin synthase